MTNNTGRLTKIKMALLAMVNGDRSVRQSQKDAIGGDIPVSELHMPVDDIETIRLEYLGEWWCVTKGESGLNIKREDSDSGKSD